MSHALVEIWLLIVMVFSGIALALAAILIHGNFWQKQDKFFRVGFLLLCLGLGVQTFRSIHYLQFGSYPMDHYFPTWAVKDIGFCLIVYSKFIASRKGS